MLHISRRYVKHFAIPDPSDEITGYKSMAELCKDLNDVINIIWLSGTRESNTAFEFPARALLVLTSF